MTAWVDNDREEVAREFGKAHGQGGDPAAHDEPEEAPAEEEPGPGTVGFADIDVLPSGLGEHGPQLGEGQGPAKRDQAADGPNDEEPARATAGIRR